MQPTPTKSVAKTKSGLRSRLVLGVALIIGVGTPLILTAGSANPAVPAAASSAPPAGSVLSWGDNTLGYLGIGNATGPETCSSTPCSTSPVQASLPAGAVAASVTSHHFSSLALTTSGSLLSWGLNNAGQLGIGTTTGPDSCASSVACSTTPVAVHMPAGTIVTADATGHEFALAVTNAGQVYAWGYNGNGQLGQGNTTDSDLPVLVPLPSGTSAVAVAAGHDTSYALTSSGAVYAWGRNGEGELGIGNDTGPTTCGGSSVPCATSPIAVPLPSGTTVNSIAAGAQHVLALTSAGAILAWGRNQDGQVGIGNTTTPQTSPVAVSPPPGTTFRAVATGHFFSLGLTSSGTVYTWGENDSGQLGNANTTNQPTPGAVSMPPGITIAAIAGGSEHSVALTTAGQVYSWGRNAEGQLGIGNSTGPGMCSGEACSTIPVAVPLPGGAMAKSIAAGNYFSLVVVGTLPGLGYWLGASDGGVFAEGNAPFYGSLGNLQLNKPIVGMAATPGGQGYWLVASDGGVFSEGNAQFYGSLGNLKLNQPIVGMAPTPDGAGYWLVASDGGIFAEGDATFLGSTGNLHLNKPVVGMAATVDGGGYWLVAADGGIFNYGDAGFYGSTGNLKLNKPVVGMSRSPSGKGYWLVASDGGIFAYGDAGFFGSTGNLVLNKPIVAMATP